MEITRPPGFEAKAKRGNAQARKRIEAIERRISHLEDRVEGKNHDRKAGEVEALKWMLGIVKQWVKDDPLIWIKLRSEWARNCSVQEAVDLLGREALLSAGVESSGRYEVNAVTVERVGDADQWIRISLYPLADWEQAQNKGEEFFYLSEDAYERITENA